MTEVQTYPPVLDACCGPRSFWFDRKDIRAVYVDKRRETHALPPCKSYPSGPKHVIDPDVLADFTALPFPDNTFAHVVFDPPHIIRREARGNLTKKYGILTGDWREMLRKGFAECFRVLRPDGVLVFKWNETEVPIAEVLALTPEKPLYGHRSGKASKTHWIAFLKPNAPDQARLQPSPEAGCSASELTSQPERPLADRYNELLYAVARKFPGESRHETALRYIRQAEEVHAGPCMQNVPHERLAKGETENE